jgi:hypothetical protein
MIQLPSRGNLPSRILEKIKEVNKQPSADDVADELVELAEEILQQMAAVGMVQYLKHAPQKDVYNDFLVQLFNSSGYDYNAGPLYRWAANMIRECPETRNSARFAFFWEKSEEKEVLCKKVHQFAELRNSVMHGFFVLPPERNVEEASKIQELLQELANCDFFTVEGDYHFWGKDGFTGQWNIKEVVEWNKLMSETLFGTLCKRIVSEQQESFWTEAEKAFDNGNENLVPDALKDFIAQKNQGAFALWTHPSNPARADEWYAAAGSWLRSQPDILFVGYPFHGNGISYTQNFLMHRLLQLFNRENKSKSLHEQIKKFRAEIPNKKLVVLINRFHVALFSNQHVSKWINFLFENNIMLVAVGHHYGYFDAFFNARIEDESLAVLPDTETAKAELLNYLRFKGPSRDAEEDKEDALLLEKILEKLLTELKAGNAIYARKFADINNYPMEFVHEIFDLLHPWINIRSADFQEDRIDELYGFPVEMTEVTPLYLALGRRDVKLEYQHKVLSL